MTCGVDGGPPRAVADRTLLIVEDDKPFSKRLARAMKGHGYEVRVAESVIEGLSIIDQNPPAYAVIDMRLGDGTGLDVIAKLRERRPEARGVILTGYGNIATAVAAIKQGAYDYLAKPADADEIHGTLMAPPGRQADLPTHLISADRVRWEHIKEVFEATGCNVSETARRLRMHRRSLQRILSRRPPA